MFKNTIALALATFAVACGSAPQRASTVASSPICPSGTVRSDAELERFRSCTRVAGDLTVENVSSLEALSDLRQVDGALRIQRTDRLYSLEGLESLENLRELSIHKNSALINAGSLNGVAQVYAVAIQDNPRLTKSFGLLNGLRMQPSRVTVRHNAGLDAEGVRVTAENVQIAQR